MEKIKEQYSMPRCDIEELKEEIKYLKSLLQQIRPHIGFNGYFSVSEQTRILDLMNKIDEVLK